MGFSKSLFIVVISMIIVLFGCKSDINTERAINILDSNGNALETETGVFEFESILINTNKTETFTISNTGISNLMLKGDPIVEISGDGEVAFSVTEQPETLIRPGETTSYTVEFTPPVAQPYEITITILSNDTDLSPYTFTIKGTGLAPGMNIKQEDENILNGSGSFDFGNVIVTESSPETTFTIENLGSFNLALTGSPKIEISGTDVGLFEINESSTSSPITTGDSTTFAITFSPDSIGSKSATISIANDDPDRNPYTFEIVGNGISPEMNIKQDADNIPSSTGTFDFEKVLVTDSSPAVVFTIENIGTSDLHLTGSPTVVISGADVAMFTIDQTSTVNNIEPGNATSFTITFEPLSIGSKTAEISITNDDLDENPYTFTLIGTGISPEINIKQATTNIPSSSGSYQFGSVLVTNSSVVTTFTIENLGTADLNLTGSPKIQVSGNDPSMFTVVQTMTNSPVTPSNSTTFTITFSPTSTGSKLATITIPNDDLDEGTYAFTVFGTGITPEINVKQDSVSIPSGTGTYDFGNVFYKESSSIILFTIENTGTGNLELTGTPKVQISGTDSALFTIDQGTTFTPVAPGNSTTFTITFYPASSIGPKQATISIANTDLDENPYTFTVIGLSTTGEALGWIGDRRDGWQTSYGARPDNTFDSFDLPHGACVDNYGNVYVADRYNHRISKWNSAGYPQGWIGGGSNGWHTSDGASPTSYYRGFDMPTGVYVDTSGYIYVADFNNNRVCRWDSQGRAQGWIGDGYNGWQTYYGNASPGSSYRYFDRPTGVFVDTAGYIYVTEYGNNRVSKWDRDGRAVGVIGGGYSGWQQTSISNYGNDYRYFNRPSGLWVDGNGDLYIADTYNHRVSKWDRNGYAIGWLGGKSNGWQTTTAPLAGSDLQSFSEPSGVTVSSYGDIYVADSSNHRICKWTSSGTAIGWLGGGKNGYQIINGATHSDDYKSFYYPRSVFIDNTGTLIIADSANYRISRWHE